MVMDFPDTVKNCKSLFLLLIIFFWTAGSSPGHHPVRGTCFIQPPDDARLHVVIKRIVPLTQ